MKIVDNFELFKSKLEFDSEDDFYFVQILIRGKDGHTEVGVNGNNKNRLVKFYTIKSVDHLTKVESEIKLICEAINGRAYIHPTRRSFKEVADEMFRNFTQTYLSQNHLGLKGCYSAACGKSYQSKHKRYIIDLDGDDCVNVANIIKFINTECEPFDTIKFDYMVPTIHGVHLICKPFNVARFGQMFPLIDVHKNNPSLLFYKSLE